MRRQRKISEDALNRAKELERKEEELRLRLEAKQSSQDSESKRYHELTGRALNSSTLH
jgi:hypothetical protein